jgi:hypothetical protein
MDQRVEANELSRVVVADKLAGIRSPLYPEPGNITSISPCCVFLVSIILLRKSRSEVPGEGIANLKEGGRQSARDGEPARLSGLVRLLQVGSPASQAKNGAA